jgi:hypothetical protein
MTFRLPWTGGVVNAANAPNPDDHDSQAAVPVTNRLHPRIYALIVVLALWFVLAVWSFAGGGLSDYPLVIVSSFIGVTAALTLILSRVGHADPGQADPGHADPAMSGDAAKGDEAPPPLRDWASWDFHSGAGRLSGAQAAMQILLPIAAAAVGMTVIGIAFHIAEHSV